MEEKYESREVVKERLREFAEEPEDTWALPVKKSKKDKKKEVRDAIVYDEVIEA